MAIRRPPTTFSDTISTADIADDAVTGGKLANDIAISTTGNIATTGSGTLTVAGTSTLTGNSTIGGTLATTGALTASGGIANSGTITAGTVGSSVVFPAGHVVKTQRYESSEQTNITGTSFDTTKTVGSFAFTPQFASSNILLMASVISNTNSAGGYIYMDFYKNASDVTATANLSGYNHGVCLNHNAAVWQSKFVMCLDQCSENSTSEKTYKISAKLNANGSGYIGWGANSPTYVIIQEIAT